jgi:hypothetical protein
MKIKFKEEEVFVLEDDNDSSVFDITKIDLAKIQSSEANSTGSNTKEYIFDSDHYVEALIEKVANKSKAYCRAFIEYQFEFVKDPVSWLGKVTVPIYERKMRLESFGDLEPYKSLYTNFLSASDEISHDPKKIDGKSQGSKEGLRFYMTVEEMRVFNELLYRTEIIKENNKTDWERFLSSHFKPKINDDLVSFRSLSKNRGKYDAKAIVNIEKILSRMLRHLNQL